MARVLIFLALLVAMAAPAAAVTLRHDDLVGVAAEGIIRIDGQTGAREVITSLVPASDLAVAYGGAAIYTVSADSLYEIDPTTGAYRTVASGFVDAVGVTTNRLGEVFVVDHAAGSLGGADVPRLHRVDPVAGTSEMLFESRLPWLADPQASWSALDAEMVTDSLVAVLGVGSSQGPFGGCCEINGIVGFDILLDAESILVNSADFGAPSPPWASIHGLGVLPSGVVSASSDFNYGAWGLGYDPVTESALGTPGWDGLYDESGARIAALYSIEFTSTSDGRVFVANSGQIGWWDEALEQDRPVLPEEVGVHLVGEDGLLRLIDGHAFSPGSRVSELQAVVIPEPGIATLIGIGLVGLGLGRRRA